MLLNAHCNVCCMLLNAHVCCSMLIVMLTLYVAQCSLFVQCKALHIPQYSHVAELLGILLYAHGRFPNAH